MIYDTLLIPSEVAELLKVPVATVYELANSGTLPAFKLGKQNRMFRFSKAEVAKYGTASNTVATS